MTLDSTDRFALPFIQPGQAQKEMSHNEALARIDLCMQAAVVALGEDTSPPDPQPGQAWIVGDAPTGEWAGREGQIAGWTASGWRYVAPIAGMTVWLNEQRSFARFDAGEWREGEVRGKQLVIEGDQVVGTRRAAIANPDGGTVVDTEVRDAVQAILDAMRQHGLIASS